MYQHIYEDHNLQPVTRYIVIDSGKINCKWNNFIM